MAEDEKGKSRAKVRAEDERAEVASAAESSKREVGVHTSPVAGAPTDVNRLGQGAVRKEPVVQWDDRPQVDEEGEYKGTKEPVLERGAPPADGNYRRDEDEAVEGTREREVVHQAPPQDGNYRTSEE